MPWLQKLSEIETFTELFPISALNNKNVAKLLQYLCTTTKNSPWAYDPEILCDSTMRFSAEEITREKVFLLTQKEIPFGIEVETEKFDEQEDKITIYQNILVPKQSHKSIIIGKNASLIKEIGQQAREDITYAFDCKVNLFLHVKVLSKQDLKRKGY